MRLLAKQYRRLLVLGLLLLTVAQVLPYHIPFDTPDFPGLAPEHHERFAEAARFNAPIRWSSLAGDLTLFPLVALLMYSGWAARVENRHAEGRNRWPAIIGFFAFLFVVLFLFRLPGLFRQQLHWQAYGISKLSTPAWVLLVLKAQAIPAFKFLATNVLIFCFMSIAPRRWWIITALFLFLLYHVVPEVTGLTKPLDPVETTTPLESGALSETLQAVARQSGRECTFMVSDESQRSERINIHVTGKLGREYVVFTDNWIRKVPIEESAAAMAHELGHLVTRHITAPLSKTLGLLGSLLIMGLVARLHPVSPGHRLQAILCMLILAHAVSMLTRPALAALNRYQEHEADIYALALMQNPEALEKVLLRTGKANLVNWRNPLWHRLYTGSYPDLAKRVSVCRSWKPR